jgi:hypothetical protein
MPANAKQIIQTLDSVMKLDALNPRNLAEKYSPKLYAYM